MLDTKKLYGIAKIDSLELEEAKQNLEIDIKYYVTKILIGKVNSRRKNCCNKGMQKIIRSYCRKHRFKRWSSISCSRSSCKRNDNS